MLFHPARPFVGRSHAWLTDRPPRAAGVPAPLTRFDLHFLPVDPNLQAPKHPDLQAAFERAVIVRHEAASAPNKLITRRRRSSDAQTTPGTVRKPLAS